MIIEDEEGKEYKVSAFGCAFGIIRDWMSDMELQVGNCTRCGRK